MNTLAENPVKTIKSTLQNGLSNAMSYEEYRALVSELAVLKSNSGAEKTDALANYTQLNDKRMRRWDKTLKIPEAVEQKVRQLNRKVTWLVLTESWCGDASPSIPVMNKLAMLSPNLELKIILRDEHPDLMNLFLTNGTRSIPKLIALDPQNTKVLGEWGPRSSAATEMVNTFKAEHGKLTSEFKQDLQLFYNKDRGKDILNDLNALLALE